MGWLRHLWIFGTLLMHFGCAPEYQQSASVLENASITNTSFGDFQYESLLGGEVKKVEITAHSPAFHFAEGKSYYAAFQMPEYAVHYQIRVLSTLVGVAIDESCVFYPMVILLDSSFFITRTFAEEDFRFNRIKRMVTWGIPYAYETVIPVSEGNQHEKYMIVYSTPQQQRGEVSFEIMGFMPLITPNLVTVIPAGIRIAKVKHSATGKIVIELLEEQ
jgi:maltose operon periplasmic protein